MTGKTYSESEMQQIVASELAKQKMSEMDRKISEADRRNVGAFAELKAQISALTTLIEKQNTSMGTVAATLRQEIKRDFATKEETKAEFEKLDTKIDGQWQKLTLIVTTISVLGGVVQFLLRFVH